MPAAQGRQPLDGSRAVFGEIYPGDASGLGHPERDIAYRWVRQGNLKLIVPHTHRGDRKPWGNYLDTVALYDVAADPFETRNLATTPEYQPQLKKLVDRLDDRWTP